MEIEGPAEHVKETIHEHLSGDHGRTSTSRWHTQVALTTLVMALLSAFAALMAGLSAQASLFERTEEVLDAVALETDRIEIEVLRSKHDILRQFDQVPPEAEIARIERYREDARLLSQKTEEEEGFAQAATRAHLVLAGAVMLLSVGVTLGGVAIVADRRFLWVVGILFGLAGFAAMILGMRDMPGL